LAVDRSAEQQNDHKVRLQLAEVQGVPKKKAQPTRSENVYSRDNVMEIQTSRLATILITLVHSSNF